MRDIEKAGVFPESKAARFDLSAPIDKTSSLPPPKKKDPIPVCSFHTTCSFQTALRRRQHSNIPEKYSK